MEVLPVLVGQRISLSLLTLSGCSPPSCQLNYASYAWKIHETFVRKGKFDFLPCDGADTDDCINHQIPNLSSSADMITITIGGNNNELFSDAVKACVWNIGNDMQYCTSNITKSINTINNIKPKISSVLKDIKTKAPRARLAICTYAHHCFRVINKRSGLYPILRTSHEPCRRMRIPSVHHVLRHNQRVQQIDSQA